MKKKTTVYIMRERLKLKNEEMVKNLFLSDLKWLDNSISSLIEIIEFVEKKDILTILLENAERFKNNKKYLTDFYKSVKMVKPLKTTRTSQLFILEYRDRMEIIVKIKRSPIDSDILENHLKREINLVIEEKTKEMGVKNNISPEFFIKEINNNFLYETNFYEILNKNIVLIDKIIIKWGVSTNLNLEDNEIEEELLFLINNKKFLNLSDNLLLKCVEIAYTEKIENLLTNLIKKEKQETEERVINLMLKKIKKKSDSIYIKKESCEELTIYTYDSKKDIYINFKKSFDIEKTAIKVLQNIKEGLGNKKECFIRFKKNKRNNWTELELQREDVDNRKTIEKIENEIRILDFKKIEIKV